MRTLGQTREEERQVQANFGMRYWIDLRSAFDELQKEFEGERSPMLLRARLQHLQQMTANLMGWTYDQQEPSQCNQKP